MPESKLAEKLGFRVEGHDRIVTSGDHTTREHGMVTVAESKLWNLCLELSERLVESEKRWHLLQQPNRGIESALMEAQDRVRALLARGTVRFTHGSEANSVGVPFEVTFTKQDFANIENWMLHAARVYEQVKEKI